MSLLCSKLFSGSPSQSKSSLKSFFNGLQGHPAATSETHPSPFPRCSLSSSHASHLAILWTCQAHTSPRAFAVLSAGTLLSLISTWLTLFHPSHLCKNTPLRHWPSPPTHATRQHPHPHTPCYAYSALSFSTARTFLQHITYLLVSYGLCPLPLAHKLQGVKRLCFGLYCTLRTRTEHGTYLLLNMLKEYRSALKIIKP